MAIEDVISSSYVIVEPVVTLLDQSLGFVKDISDEVTDLTISHDNLAPVSGRVAFRSEGSYIWPTFRVQIDLTLTGLVDGVEETYTTAMGIYVPQMPAESDRLESPESARVEAFAPPYIYKTPRGNSYDAVSGTSFLTAIAGLISEVGWPTSYIDQSEAATNTPADFVWLLEDKNTTLKIINDLLLGINYQELYANRNGQLIAEPYVFPQDKSSTWTFTNDDGTSTILDEFTVTKDYAEVPNRWVFIWDDPTQVIPTEANGGIYIVTNQSDGVTSIDSRGYTRTIIVPMEYVNSTTALAAAGDRIVSQTKYPSEQIRLTSSPNPLFFHYDVATVSVPEYGYNNAKFFVRSWELNLSSLTHTFDLERLPLQ